MHTLCILQPGHNQPPLPVASPHSAPGYIHFVTLHPMLLFRCVFIFTFSYILVTYYYKTVVKIVNFGLILVHLSFISN
jgi:hypothetical protein